MRCAGWVALCPYARGNRETAAAAAVICVKSLRVSVRFIVLTWLRSSLPQHANICSVDWPLPFGPGADAARDPGNSGAIKGQADDRSRSAQRARHLLHVPHAG